VDGQRYLDKPCIDDHDLRDHTSTGGRLWPKCGNWMAKPNHDANLWRLAEDSRPAFDQELTITTE